MVDADHVEEAAGALHPADPPAEAVGAHPVIVVQGVAPELAVGGKVVRRHAGHLGRHVALPQLEELRFRPHVGGVHGHIDGQVPDNLQPQGVDVVPQGVPLAVKEVLEVGEKVHVLPQLPPVALHRLRRSDPDIGVGPLQPALHAEVALHRHVQRVVGQPRILPGKGLHRRPVPVPAPPEGPAQHGKPVFVDPAEVHMTGVAAPVDALQLGAFQQAVGDQQIQVDEVGVPGEGGKALVGAVPIAGGTEGQKLPVGLARGLQKVGEGVGLLSQSADAVGGGEGGDMQKDAAGAVHVHHAFSNRVPPPDRRRNYHTITAPGL